MTAPRDTPNEDAPVACGNCDGHHRPSYTGDCRGWDHNFTHLDLLSSEEVVRVPEGAVVLNSHGDKMVSDRHAHLAVHGK